MHCVSRLAQKNYPPEVQSLESPLRATFSSNYLYLLCLTLSNLHFLQSILITACCFAILVSVAGRPYCQLWPAFGPILSPRRLFTRYRLLSSTSLLSRLAIRYSIRLLFRSQCGSKNTILRICCCCDLRCKKLMNSTISDRVVEQEVLFRQSSKNH